MPKGGRRAEEISTSSQSSGQWGGLRPNAGRKRKFNEWERYNIGLTASRLWGKELIKLSRRDATLSEDPRVRKEQLLAQAVPVGKRRQWLTSQGGREQARRMRMALAPEFEAPARHHYAWAKEDYFRDVREEARKDHEGAFEEPAWLHPDDDDLSALEDTLTGGEWVAFDGGRRLSAREAVALAREGTFGGRAILYKLGAARLRSVKRAQPKSSEIYRRTAAIMARCLKQEVSETMVRRCWAEFNAKTAVED